MDEEFTRLMSRLDETVRVYKKTIRERLKPNKLIGRELIDYNKQKRREITETARDVMDAVVKLENRYGPSIYYIT